MQLPFHGYIFFSWVRYPPSPFNFTYIAKTITKATPLHHHIKLNGIHNQNRKSAVLYHYFSHAYSWRQRGIFSPWGWLTRGMPSHLNWRVWRNQNVSSSSSSSSSNSWEPKDKPCLNDNKWRSQCGAQVYPRADVLLEDLPGLRGTPSEVWSKYVCITT